jgi:hypothetical protein
VRAVKRSAAAGLDVNAFVLDGALADAAQTWLFD